MKFIPLHSQPNVSSARFNSVSPSMSTDSRGFPHLAWLNVKNGHNELHYSFWDGLQWSNLSQSFVSWSEFEISYSKNGLILDNDIPVLAHSKRSNSGSYITVSVASGNGWITNVEEVAYDTNWVGITKVLGYYGDLGSSSSESSSSSEVYVKPDYFVLTYDDSNLRVYSVSQSLWELMGTISCDIVSISSIKISSCGDYIGITYLALNGEINYNFFNPSSLQWSFASFQVVSNAITIGTIIDIDSYGLSLENGTLAITWLEDLSSSFNVKYTYVDNLGVETFYYTVDSRSKVVTPVNSISDGFTKIALALDSSDYSKIYATGAETDLYSGDGAGTWGQDIIDIQGASGGFVPDHLNITIFGSKVNTSFSNDSSGIYYFEESSDVGGDIGYPDITLLTNGLAFITTWDCGLLDGEDVASTGLNRVGDILRDSLKPVVIVANEGGSSSSSSSSSSMSSDSGITDHTIIKTINTKDKEVIEYRTVIGESYEMIQSISVNNADGSFVTTEPLKGDLVVYPQSPNNSNYDTVTYNSFGTYGLLSLPLDARFDSIRRKLLIADAGNSRVLRAEINGYSIEQELEEIVLPHSVIPERNLGGSFVKAFSDISTGVIYYYNKSGELIDSFTYPCELGHATVDVEFTEEYVESLPLTSTMAYDSDRWRLWWVSDLYVYMFDVRNQVIIKQLTGYPTSIGIDVDSNTGNAIVIVEDGSDESFLIQIFRDNNQILCSAYAEEV